MKKKNKGPREKNAGFEFFERRFRLGVMLLSV